MLLSSEFLLEVQGLLTGFDIRRSGWIDRVPMLTGVQADGSMPIVQSFQAGRIDFDPVGSPETVATAIRIGNPVSGRKALKAIYSTGGCAIGVTDEEILQAQRMLGRREGVGVEPASAASIAGLIKLRANGEVGRDERVVCICTGNALKDPDTIIKSCPPPLQSKADAAEIKRLLQS